MILPPRMDKSRAYYLSGPMSGYEEHNFPAFRRIANSLRVEGIKIVSPVELAQNVNHESPKPWVEYLRLDLLEMLTSCSGIILMVGWPSSTGARFELDVALRLGFPAYYFTNHILVDMNDQRS